MIFSFHPEAKEEFNEAIEYYEDCEPGLGYDFSIEGHAAIQNIVNYPTACVANGTVLYIKVQETLPLSKNRQP